MFSKKTKLKLTDFECNLLINGMNEFRNVPISSRVCDYNFPTLITATQAAIKD